MMSSPQGSNCHFSKAFNPDEVILDILVYITSKMQVCLQSLRGLESSLHQAATFIQGQWSP